uniref:Exonuclease V, chloroplastic n=1 Tax=Fagus sylvatica TaxID=28930 RepID=A0A2N9FGA6_FAGSY
MDESQSELSLNISNNSNNGTIDIPIEFVSEEEMASIDSALASTSLSILSSSVAPELVSQEDMASTEAALAASIRSSLSSSAICSTSQSQFQRNARYIQSITLRAKRRFSVFIEPDIEDLGSLRSNQKKSRVAESFLHRFRNKTGLFVSDITSTEWCEKQMEFILLFGKRKNTEAMKIGRARHAILKEEVVKKVELHLNSDEDRWAVKLTNFIIGANQLLCEGLTRELPLISFAEGIWMVGEVDEVRMPVTETDRLPIFMETKTRVTNTLPAEPQRRKGRLQLMCYKYLWDKLVSDSFPSKQFFNFFSLDPYYLLSEEIRENTAKAGFPVKTLDDVVSCYISTCSTLPPSQHKLLLRYEYQKDNSLLGEEEFAYDSDWLKSQILGCLEFWKGEREANCTPKEERWKCCFFNDVVVSSSSCNLSAKRLQFYSSFFVVNADPSHMLAVGSVVRDVL